MILHSLKEYDRLPQRIVSLVPSQTELLFDLGLREQVVGITKFCIRPPGLVKGATIVGGTKNIAIGRVNDLVPDLVIANREENVKEEVEQLALDYPVWVTDVVDLHSALAMIRDIGQLTGKVGPAEKICLQIATGFNNLGEVVPALPAAYLIWREPWMAAGGGTFINDMLARCGLRNIFADTPRYPSVSIDDIIGKQCKLLMLSSEPYPFQAKHIEELATHLPGVQICLVDGEMFSWYGSRLIHAPAYFHNLLQAVIAVT